MTRLNKEFVAALKQPDFIEWEESLGSEAIPSTPEEFASYIKSETARWARIIKAAKVTLE